MKKVIVRLIILLTYSDCLYAVSVVPPRIVYVDKTTCVKAIVSEYSVFVVRADNVLEYWLIDKKQKIKQIKLPYEICHEDDLDLFDNASGPTIIGVKDNSLYVLNLKTDSQFRKVEIKADCTVRGKGFDENGNYYCTLYESDDKVDIKQYNACTQKLVSYCSIPVEVPMATLFDSVNHIWTIYEADGTAVTYDASGSVIREKGKYVQPLLSDQSSQIKILLDEEDQCITAYSILTDEKIWEKCLLQNESIVAQSQDGRVLVQPELDKMPFRLSD